MYYARIGNYTTRDGAVSAQSALVGIEADVKMVGAVLAAQGEGIAARRHRLGLQRLDRPAVAHLGQVCLYNGKAAQTFYYSSNGGASESVSIAWESNQSLYPYLVGVVDPYEASLNLNNSWTRTVSSSELPRERA